MEEIKTQYPIDHYILGGDFNLCLERRDSRSNFRKSSITLSIFMMLQVFYTKSPLSDDTQEQICQICYCQSAPRYGIQNTTENHWSLSSTNLLYATKRRQNWKFTDTLISSPELIQGLLDNIRETLSVFTNNLWWTCRITLNSLLNLVQPSSPN